MASTSRRRRAASTCGGAATYEAQKDLILVGAYKKGSDPRTDYAVSKLDSVNAFLRQTTDERTPPSAALQQLQRLF